MQVDLAAGTASDGTGGTDTLISIERVIGSNFNDTLRGSAAGNSFTGEAGDDLIDGRGGIDFVFYGRAPRAVTVDLAAGTARGGEGNDRLISIEEVGGSNFGDRLFGTNGANFFTTDQLGDELHPQFRRGGADSWTGAAASTPCPTKARPAA